MTDTTQAGTKDPGITGAGLLSAVLHADLSDAHRGEDYFLVVGDQRIPMLAHNEATHTAALRSGPGLTGLRAGARLTHHTAQPIALPTHSVIRVHFKHTMRTFDDAAAPEGVGCSALYVPPPVDKCRLLQASNTAFHFGPVDYLSTAETFLFHHPDLINARADLTTLILERYMRGDKAIALAINNMAALMRDLGPPTETSGWARLVPVKPDNERLVGQTFYRQDPTDEVLKAAHPALSRLLVLVQNDRDFRDKKWTVQQGAAVERQDGRKQLALAAERPQTTLELGDPNWNAEVTYRETNGFSVNAVVKDRAKRQVEVYLRNTHIRYLVAYIQFFDAAGNAMKVPTWGPDDRNATYNALVAAEVAGGMKLQYDDVRLLGLLQPLNCFLGIPIYSDPGMLDLKLTFPPGAVRAQIYGSGLGTGANPWPNTPALGGTLTGILNLGVPAIMLGFATATQTYKPLYDVVSGLTKEGAFIAYILGLGVTWIAGSSAAQNKVDWRAISQFGQFIFMKGGTKILVWVETETATQKAKDQIPFAGWIMLAINIATTIAQMAQTIVSVTTSAWNIERKLATTITTSIAVKPDPRHKAFPQGAAGAKRKCTVKMIYKDDTRPTPSQDLDVSANADTLAASFAKNTLGGKVKIEADFYIDTWLAGKATTGWIDNDLQHAAEILMYLVEFPVPLDDKSVYKHARMLTFQNNAYVWMDTPQAPTKTLRDRNTSSSGNALADWTGIALSQRTGTIGFSWQAAGTGLADCDTQSKNQLYTFMNVPIPGLAGTTAFPSCGFVGRSRLVYDPYPPKFKMVDGAWVIQNGLPVPDPNAVQLGEYYVDPRQANVDPDLGGGYHLRKVSLTGANPFDMSRSQKSYGRFAYFPDSVAMHPTGLVIGVNSQFSKLQIVTLLPDGAADINVPIGRIGAGPATDPKRPGLMFRPAAVTCSYDGTIIVLEETKSSSGGTTPDAVSRLSAYDLNMDPVSRFFDANKQPTPWLNLPNAANNNYLDVACVGDEELSYIYLLYYTGAGLEPKDYHMSIFVYGKTPPAKNPLVTTDAIPAARLAVDMWHSAYTLNFGMVTNGQGKEAGPGGSGTGPNGRTVPSISMWLPPIPH